MSAYLNTRDVADSLRLRGYDVTDTPEVAVVWLGYSETVAIHADGRCVAESYDRTAGLQSEVELGRTSSLRAAVTTVESYRADRAAESADL